LKYVKDTWGIEKDEVLVTAQSLTHDHVPATTLGLGRCWINRSGAIIGNAKEGNEGEEFDWEFGSLKEMVEGIKKERL